MSMLHNSLQYNIVLFAKILLCCPIVALFIICNFLAQTRQLGAQKFC